MTNKEMDFPVLNGKWPMTIPKALIIIASLSASFILFNKYIPTNNIFHYIINAGLPLVVLYLLRFDLRELFKPFIKNDGKVIGKMLLLALLLMIMNIIVISLFFEGVANPIGAELKNGTLVDSILLLLGTLPMLLGEEVLTILFFLVILWVNVEKIKMPPKGGMIVALVLSCLAFGALHLPTYDWHFYNALVGIGLARLPLTLAYIKTKNILVSFSVHVIYDWLLFIPSIFR